MAVEQDIQNQLEVANRGIRKYQIIAHKHNMHINELTRDPTEAEVKARIEILRDLQDNCNLRQEERQLEFVVDDLYNLLVEMREQAED